MLKAGKMPTGPILVKNDELWISIWKSLFKDNKRKVN